MIRKTMKMLLAVLMTVCAFASMAEAAPTKAVRHRAKHSTRVSTSTAPSAAAKAAKRAKTKRRAASHSTATARNRPAATPKPQ